jgi:hypothetical protein
MPLLRPQESRREGVPERKKPQVTTHVVKPKSRIDDIDP